jgi:transcriptional regulator with XRE-family HTH domain
MLIDQLVRLRHHRNLPATILGARTGIDASAIYAYEHGRRDPRVSTAEAWARGLGARLIAVDTHGRASAAETAARIQDHLRVGDRNAAAQALLQYASTLQVCDVLAAAALTVDEPES